MSDGMRRQEEGIAKPAASEAKQPYEAPRIVKKRSVSRATLVTACGPDSTGGVVAAPCP